MGHTQCVSQTSDNETNTRITEGLKQGTDRSSSVQKSAGVPVNSGRMILPTLVPEKSLIPIRLKDPGLEPRQREPSNDGFQREGAMAHLSESGWYWGCITAVEAKQLLNDATEGTFLLRDSSNPGYLLTLSVKTSLGPTHLRIAYSNGVFGFDSAVMARPRLRRFKGVVELVQHYAMAHWLSSSLQDQVRPLEEAGEEEEVGSEEAAAAPESTLQLKLTRPLYKSAPSLQHMCRIVINQHSQCHSDLPLPDRLKRYLLEYPFLL